MKPEWSKQEGVPDMYSSAWNFMMYFDGSRQPVMHNYPWTFIIPGGAIVLYLCMVYFLQRWMRSRPAMEFPVVLRLWNLFMSILALCMLTGLVAPIIKLASLYNPLEDPLRAVYMLTCSPDYEMW